MAKNNKNQNHITKMSANTTSVTEPHEYQVSFDATIPNVHPTAMPDERQRVALSRQVTAWSALDAANQVKMEVEREYRLDKAKPSWKALNGVNPSWKSRRGVVDLKNHPTNPTRRDDDPIKLLRRISKPKAFMDLEGLRIICADFVARWDETNYLPNTQAQATQPAPQNDEN